MWTSKDGFADTDFSKGMLELKETDYECWVEVLECFIVWQCKSSDHVNRIIEELQNDMAYWDEEAD